MWALLAWLWLQNPLAAEVRPATSAPALATRLLVRFEGEDTPSHEFTFIALAQDRARIELRRLEQPFSTRRLHYISGEQGFVVEAGRSSSAPLSAPEKLDLDRQVALRRAVYLWPDGFAWIFANETATCDLGAIGRLEAKLETGRLREATAFDATGVAREGLHIKERFQSRGREWPRVAEVTAGGQRLWIEMVSSVETELHYLDLFFVPPDRRTQPPSVAAGTSESAGEILRILDTPPRWIRRHKLTAVGPEAVRAQVVSLHTKESQAAAEHGLVLENFAALLLDERGVPIELELRAKREPSADPIEGWECTSERSAITLISTALIDWSGAGVRERLARLAAKLPKDARSLPAYWVAPASSFAVAAAPARIQLVLPFEAQGRR